METTAIQQQVNLIIPSSDYNLVRTLSKKMGWTLHHPRKSGLQKAVEDVQAGRVFEAKNVDELLEQLEA